MQRVSYCVARFIALYGSSGDKKNKKIKKSNGFYEKVVCEYLCLSPAVNKNI